jgi:hypothetical protein
VLFTVGTERRGKDDPCHKRRYAAFAANKNPCHAGIFYGRYWARTSDPQLVELVLSDRFAGSFSSMGKYLGKSHSGEGGFERIRAETGSLQTRPNSVLRSSLVSYSVGSSVQATSRATTSS